MKSKLKPKIVYFKPGQIIAFMYLGLIFLGSILLWLNISHTTKTSFLDSFFVATSAVCVTGLTPVDTALNWTIFGKIIIITLIQIGGLGIMTVTIMLFYFGKTKIGLRERTMIQDVTNNNALSGGVKLSKFIYITTIAVELFFAFILFFGLDENIPAIQRFFHSLFYSISAFCNAGFDLTGHSLTDYTGNVIVNLSIQFLIIIGGIGFLTMSDIKKNKLKISKYSLQTKIVLATTIFLIIVPALYFYLIEFSRDVWADLTLKEKILASFFQTVTTRTAGFNTVDLTKLLPTSAFIMDILMIIGGAPTSTAGGFKVTTFFVMIATVTSIIKGKNNTEAFQKTIDTSVINKALALFATFLFFTIMATIAISIIENVSLSSAAFESASAIGTVGLTMSLTPSLSPISKCILIFLMLFGRVGGLTFLTSFTLVGKNQNYKYPVSNVVVG